MLPMDRPGPPGTDRRLGLLLAFVLVSFALNSLITRKVVTDGLLDAAMTSTIRFIAGAVALVAFTVLRGERVVVGRVNLLPALWLALYAVCISFGYRYIGAAPGTFVFYATVLVTLVAHDMLGGARVPVRRPVGAVVALAGVAYPVVMGVVTTSMAYVAWYAAQRSMSATAAGTAQLGVPVLTAAGAVLLLGESLSPALFAAAALVGSGMWLARSPRGG
jgi:drug/metabolite transporter (DMT)-like permease